MLRSEPRLVSPKSIIPAIPLYCTFVLFYHASLYTLHALLRLQENTTKAVNKAVDDGILADVLASFLRGNKAEVLRVYLAEVNENQGVSKLVTFYRTLSTRLVSLFIQFHTAYKAVPCLPH